MRAKLLPSAEVMWPVANHSQGEIVLPSYESIATQLKIQSTKFRAIFLKGSVLGNLKPFNRNLAVQRDELPVRQQLTNDWFFSCVVDYSQS